MVPRPLIGVNDGGNARIPAVLIPALLGCSIAHAAPPCQDMADKVAKEFAAEKKMSDLDKPAKCRAIYKIISDLSDMATQCGADTKFIDGTYKPLAKAVGDEAPNVCKG
ncbi:MAG TPA: hypothetical protein VGN99_00415 [Steroidobacteraceae bacterium]|jgi:hypothetical protein|nr:hypothetical protein [Steroidobacteraceae bacterium]